MADRPPAEPDRHVHPRPFRCLQACGAALVEYALLLALIAVVCIVALTTLCGQASSKSTRSATHSDERS